MGKKDNGCGRKSSVRITLNDTRTIICKEVHNFIFLGVMIPRHGDSSIEIEVRLNKGDRCAAGLRHIIKFKNISEKD